MGFKDSQGREWPVTITVATVQRVRTDTGFDLGSALKPDGIDKLAGDFALFGDILYSICRPACERAQIPKEKFLEELTGDVLDQATKAFLAALVSFCPSPETRKALEKLLRASDEATREAIAQIEQDVDPDRLKADLKSTILKMAGAPSSASSPGTPGSSVLTQGPSPFASSSGPGKSEDETSGTTQPT